MARNRSYYTLLVRESERDPWAIHFGDYDRDTVEDERYIERHAGDYAAINIRIITTGDTQAEIDAEVDRLNAGRNVQ